MVFLFLFFCHQSSHIYTHKQVHRERRKKKKRERHRYNKREREMSTIAIVWKEINVE